MLDRSPPQWRVVNLACATAAKFSYCLGVPSTQSLRFEQLLDTMPCMPRRWARSLAFDPIRMRPSVRAPDCPAHNGRSRPVKLDSVLRGDTRQGWPSTTKSASLTAEPWRYRCDPRRWALARAVQGPSSRMTTSDQACFPASQATAAVSRRRCPPGSRGLILRRQICDLTRLAVTD